MTSTSISCLCSELQTLSLHSSPPSIFALNNDALKHIVHYVDLTGFLSLRMSSHTGMQRCTPNIFYTHERFKKTTTKTVAEFARCIAANDRWFYTLINPVKDFFKLTSLANQQQFFTVLARHTSLQQTIPLFLQCQDSILDTRISQEFTDKPVAVLFTAFSHLKKLTLNKIPPGSIPSYIQSMPLALQSLDLFQSAPLSDSDFLSLLKRLPNLTHLKISSCSLKPFTTVPSASPLKTLSIASVVPAEEEMDVQGIELLSALTQLDIRGNLSKESFTYISKISGLQELIFSGSVKTPAAIEPLKELTSLTSLKLSSNQLTMPIVLSVLKDKATISAVSLSFNGTQAVTGADCIQIAQSCPNLTSLCLPDQLQATDAEIRTFLGKMKSRPLTKLTFALPREIQKETVTLLFNTVSLQGLHLGCQNNVLSQSLRISGITSLSITQPVENQPLLCSLANLPKLQCLSLSLPFTDQDTYNVYLAPALHTFMYTYEEAQKLTDHGFKILCSSRSIRQIDIRSSTKFTRKGVMNTLRDSPDITYCRVRLPPGRAVLQPYDPADGLYQIFKIFSPPGAENIVQARHSNYVIEI